MSENTTHESPAYEKRGYLNHEFRLFHLNCEACIFVHPKSSFCAIGAKILRRNKRN